MQRFSVVMALVGLVALTFVTTGCVSEQKYNAVLLRNREQEKLLQDKEAQMATLTERVEALQARLQDAQQMLQEKDEYLGSVMKERDTVRASFEKLLAMYPMAPHPSGVGISEVIVVALEDLAKQYPDMLEFDAATGRMRFKSDVTFDSGSNVVKAEARTAIGKLAVILASDAAMGIQVTVVGHTDSDPVKRDATKTLLKGLGKAQNNQGLSDARSESVADILKGGGVAAGRITTKGVGESQPIADNRSADGKAKNRRVEIFMEQPAGAAPAAPASVPTAAPMMPQAPPMGE